VGLLQSMSETGDFDHCYYNELCRIRVEDLSDFNHLISNLLYIIFGLTFIIIVYWRSVTLFNRKQYRAIHRGLCVPFGAYIAMGMSLMMEGVLSSAYHFCPSSSTFQFGKEELRSPHRCSQPMGILNSFPIPSSRRCFHVCHCRHLALNYSSVEVPCESFRVKNNSNLLDLNFENLNGDSNFLHSRTKAFLLLTILTIISALFYVIEGKYDEGKATIARLIFAGVHILFTASYCLGLYYHGTIKDANGSLRLCRIHKISYCHSTQFILSTGKWMLGFYKGVTFALMPTRLRLKLSGTPFKVTPNVIS